tara:strand:+ start:147474 stop:147941 length:468 start_codon:yes stop_codon:yes gene_type:complete
MIDMFYIITKEPVMLLDRTEELNELVREQVAEMKSSAHELDVKLTNVIDNFDNCIKGIEDRVKVINSSNLDSTGKSNLRQINNNINKMNRSVETKRRNTQGVKSKIDSILSNVKDFGAANQKYLSETYKLNSAIDHFKQMRNAELKQTYDLLGEL